MYRAYKAALVIDCTGGAPIRNGVVLVCDNKIEAVGRADEVAVPAGSEIRDLGDCTILPGLIDGHGHMCFSFGADFVETQMVAPEQELVIRAVKYLEEKVRNGMTTMRNPGEKAFIDLACKRSIESGFIEGPRLVTAGKGIRPGSGHGNVATVFDGPVAIRAAIRENYTRGANFVKLFLTGGNDWNSKADTCYYSRDEIAAAVEEAKRIGVKVGAHCMGGIALDWAIELGIDAIEHGTVATDEQLDRMAEKGTVLVTTACYLYAMKADEEGRRKQEIQKESQRQVHYNAYRRGVKMVAGSDDGGSLVTVQGEIELMTLFGIPPMDALLMGTRNAAELIDMQDSVGTLEPGKLADLIAVRGNPLDDIKALYNLTLVVKDGKEVVTLPRTLSRLDF